MEDNNDNLEYELMPSDSCVTDSALSGNVPSETVFTHIEEQPQWDMSDLILDLETKEAELLILQELLSQKEHALQVCPWCPRMACINLVVCGAHTRQRGCHNDVSRGYFGPRSSHGWHDYDIM